MTTFNIIHCQSTALHRFSRILWKFLKWQFLQYISFLTSDAQPTVWITEDNAVAMDNRKWSGTHNMFWWRLFHEWTTRVLSIQVWHLFSLSLDSVWQLRSCHGIISGSQHTVNYFLPCLLLQILHIISSSLAGDGLVRFRRFICCDWSATHWNLTTTVRQWLGVNSC